MCESVMDCKENCKDVENKQTIGEFYIGKSVLITGVTGFLGKVRNSAL